MKNYQEILSELRILDLSGWQGYVPLYYHYCDALQEKQLSLDDATPDPPYAKFSVKYYNTLKNLCIKKDLDYCFIGSLYDDPMLINNPGYNSRLWINNFVKKYFTDNSIFINTSASHDNYKKIGSFDLTHEHIEGIDIRPKQAIYRNINNNIKYFEYMARSKFILCPAGDSPWSYRFYETLMVGSMPVVQTWHHTYRTREESKIPYCYTLSVQTPHQFDENCIFHNHSLFTKYHLI